MKKEDINLLDFFPAAEGEINLRYGRIGTGKTTTASIDIKKRLRRGEVVYANWKIVVDDINELESSWCIFLWWIGLKNKFTIIKCSENLIYFPIDDEYARTQTYTDSKGDTRYYTDFVDWLSRLTDCAIYLDEGHLVLDSYLMAKQSLKQRAAVLHTRHFNRTINIISQRPTAIHVTARANVNRFFKCQRPFPRLQQRIGVVIIVVQEFQDMINETVDEESGAVSTRWYWLSKKQLSSFDTKYMRQGLPPSQTPKIEIWATESGDRWKVLKGLIRRGTWRSGRFSGRAPDGLQVKKQSP